MNSDPNEFLKRTQPSLPMRSMALSLVGAVALSLAGCDPNATMDNSVDQASSGAGVESATSALTTKHRYGNKRDNTTRLNAKRLSSVPRASATLPTSIDLAGRLPPPGDQQTQGSCTSWAIAYATKSYHEALEMSWAANTTNHQFSPAWVYNQINGGTDAGSYIGDALDLLVNKGADTLDSFPYVTSDFTKKPSTLSLDRASHFKAKSWNSITVSETNFKNALAGGNPVIIGTEVFPDFELLNATTNTIYDSTAGTLAPSCTVAPCDLGRHALAVIGYDDAKKAFKIINSWGTSWGSGGYGWIAYSMLTNTAVAMDAYLLTDAPNTGAMGYGICGFGEPGCERQAATLHRMALDCNGGLLGAEAATSLAGGYGNFTCESRFQSQCVDDGTADSYYMEWCDFQGPTCAAKGAKHFGCDPGATPAGTCKPTVLHRKTYSCDGKLLAGEATTNLVTTGYGNFKCGNRFNEQCVQDGSWDVYYSEWCEYDCQ